MENKEISENISIEQTKQEITKQDKEKEQNKLIFAQNILFFRNKMNISQKELTEKLQLSNKNISKWEKAETVPDVFTIKKLANLFNVSIDTLVSPMTKENQNAIKTKTAIPFKTKLYSLFLINAIIILLTCVLFYTFKSISFEPFSLYLLFLYSTPFMTLSVFIFLCVVTKKVDWISLSLLGWLITLCFYISFINVDNIEYIFIITIAYQILVLVFTKLINSRKIISFNKILIAKFKKNDNTKSNDTSNEIVNTNK